MQPALTVASGIMRFSTPTQRRCSIHTLQTVCPFHPLLSSEATLRKHIMQLRNPKPVRALAVSPSVRASIISLRKTSPTDDPSELHRTTFPVVRNHRNFVPLQRDTRSINLPHLFHDERVSRETRQFNNSALGLSGNGLRMRACVRATRTSELRSVTLHGNLPRFECHSTLAFPPANEDA